MKKIIIFLTTILLASCGKNEESSELTNALNEITNRTIENSRLGGGVITYVKSSEHGESMIRDYIISENEEYVYMQRSLVKDHELKHRMINRYSKNDLIQAMRNDVSLSRIKKDDRFVSYDGHTLIVEFEGKGETEDCPLNVHLEITAGNNYKFNYDKTVVIDCNSEKTHSTGVTQVNVEAQGALGEYSLMELEVRKDNNYGIFEFVKGKFKRISLDESTQLDLNFDGKIGE